ncbi:protein-disulfide reductase DsbD domain-containing protein [Aerobium aerolatum]|nr:protein-disulfide reductase DsbD domain-containing protein [Aquamicrobium aerolatum]
MIFSRAACLTFCIWTTTAPSLHAASSDWYRVEGGAIRVIESSVSTEDGRRRAAMEIRLDPGWKTYWQDPGSSGVPPVVSTIQDGSIAPATLNFPTPRWFADDYGSWAGYDHDVTMALTLKAPSRLNGEPTRLNVFLGICEAICIPVQVELLLDKGLNQAVAADEQIISAAFDALPAQATPAMHLRIDDVNEGELVAEAIVPAGAAVMEIFVAGNGRVTFETPTLRAGANLPTFTTRFRGAINSGDVFDYTLVTTEGAVRGQLQIP